MTPTLSAAPARRIGGTRRTWFACALLALWTGPLWAQSPTPAAAPAATPTLSLSDVMERSEEARGRLQSIEKKIPPPGSLQQMQADWARLASIVDATADETSRQLDDNPPLSVLLDIETPWRQIRPELVQRKEQLAKLGKQLDGVAAEITQLADETEEVHAALAAAHAPPEVIERDDSLRQAVAAQRQDLLARQRKLLLLRDRATAALAHADEAMADIDSFSQSRVQQIFVSETVPLWRQKVLWDTATLFAQVRQTLADFAQPLLPYLRHSGWKLLAQLLIFVLTALLLRQGRATAAAWSQRDVVLERFVGITQHPWSAALLASLVTMIPIESDAPRIIWVIAGALAIPATLRIASRVIDPQRYFLVYLLTIYSGVALLRSVFSASAPLLQGCVAVEALLACGLTWWVVRRRADRFGPRAAHYVRTYGTLGVVLLVTNFVGVIWGYLDLAQLVMFVTLGGASIGVILLMSARVALGLSAYLLRVRPLTDLRLVRRNRDRILRIITRALTGVLVVAWCILVLRDLRLFDGFLATLQGVMDVPFKRGAISVSLGDVVGFVITLWISWLLSSFIRFVLDEDIYPRVTLPRGVPYALSTLLHYLILVFGFFVALGVLGVDLTKATILAGALSVGVGFGLQNVVNNFVSGLILLFERPVQVGDTVLIRGVAGEIQHIGIRSCVVRTGDGAEVILPNAVLISDPVTNYTMSNRLRRMTIAVGAAYGSDPAVVTELLRSVAVAHDGVITSPAPSSQFTGFGDSALNFQLQVWTDRFDSWGAVQSELYLAVYKALTDAGIQIPFPQHDVHIDNTAPLPVRVVSGDGGNDKP